MPMFVCPYASTNFSFNGWVVAFSVDNALKANELDHSSLPNTTDKACTN